MCVMSMVMDHYGDKWDWYRKQYEHLPPYPTVPPVYPYPPRPQYVPRFDGPLISPEEVKEFREILERAREYDKRNGEPDCEMESKRKRIRDLAKDLGVEVDFV